MQWISIFQSWPRHFLCLKDIVRRFWKKKWLLVKFPDALQHISYFFSKKPKSLIMPEIFRTPYPQQKLSLRRCALAKYQMLYNILAIFFQKSLNRWICLKFLGPLTPNKNSVCVKVNIAHVATPAGGEETPAYCM